MFEGQPRPIEQGTCVEKGPLANKLVIDISSAAAGPLTAQRLYDLGARVIKIEPPSGDISRFLPPFYEDAGGIGIYFASFNHGKFSLGLNLKTSEGPAVLHRFLCDADVLVMNNPSAESIKSQGLDENALIKINPRLIVVAISCYGHNSPMAGVKGFDLNIQAIGGSMFLDGPEDSEEPFRTPWPWVDVNTSKEATIGVLAALIRREQLTKPRPQILDISLINSTCDLFNLIGEAANLKKEVPREGHNYRNIYPYTTVRAEDRWLTIAVGSNNLWQAFCKALGLDQLITDPRFNTNQKRIFNKKELAEIIEPLFLKDTARHWETKFHKVNVPASVVQSPSEFISSQIAQARQVLTTLTSPTGQTIQVASDPLILSGLPMQPPGYPHEIGQDTDEILKSFGYSSQEISDLRQKGVVA